VDCKSPTGIFILDKNILVGNLLRMNKLSKYLMQHAIRQKTFAGRVGVTQGVVSRLAKGALKPGLELAVRIAKETENAVPEQSWVSSSDREVGPYRSQAEDAA
jgi:DNA-binding XRE family transcriptional regulator